MMCPDVDLVVLSRDAGALAKDVQQGIFTQKGVRVHAHRVVGRPQADDACRWETIARARNRGKELGTSAWLMFVDDDVVLQPCCMRTLLRALKYRPTMGAMAADYLGERRRGTQAKHVAMGATMFRRSALTRIQFRWERGRCECQCCCDDLRRHSIGIDYYSHARATHWRAARDDHQSPPRRRSW